MCTHIHAHTHTHTRTRNIFNKKIIVIDVYDKLLYRSGTESLRIVAARADL